MLALRLREPSGLEGLAVEEIDVPVPGAGEAITGVVVRRPGSDLDEAALMAHCDARLAGFKTPKAIVFVAEFPRTGTGKLQKHLIRSQHQDLFQR